MLEIPLAEIAQTLPEDDVARWFVVPVTADEKVASEWAREMVKLVAEEFGGQTQGIRQHLEEVFCSAALAPTQPALSQRLLFLPFGASQGLHVELGIYAASPETAPEILLDSLLVSEAEDLADLVDIEGRVVGQGHFRIEQLPFEPQAGGWSEARSACQFVWALRTDGPEGLTDVLAVGTSVDAELSAVAFHTFGDLVAEGHLFQAE